jgi:hypothetical protein
LCCSLSSASFADHFVGFTNFINTSHDFRFVPAFGHIAEFIAIWLTELVVIVIRMEVILDNA